MSFRLRSNESSKGSFFNIIETTEQSRIGIMTDIHYTHDMKFPTVFLVLCGIVAIMWLGLLVSYAVPSVVLAR